MNVERNLKIVDGALNAFNDHDVERFASFYAESAIHSQPNKEEPLRGRDAIREDYANSTFKAFPDVEFEKKRSFGQGIWVCIEGVFRGTHTGPLSGNGDEVIPPTNKRVVVHICLVIKILDGKAVEVHEYNDQLGFFSQLGINPLASQRE